MGGLTELLIPHAPPHPAPSPVRLPLPAVQSPLSGRIGGEGLIVGVRSVALAYPNDEGGKKVTVHAAAHYNQRDSSEPCKLLDVVINRRGPPPSLRGQNAGVKEIDGRTRGTTEPPKNIGAPPP